MRHQDAAAELGVTPAARVLAGCFGFRRLQVEAGFGADVLLQGRLEVGVQDDVGELGQQFRRDAQAPGKVGSEPAAACWLRRAVGLAPPAAVVTVHSPSMVR